MGCALLYAKESLVKVPHYFLFVFSWTNYDEFEVNESDPRSDT